MSKKILKNSLIGAGIGFVVAIVLILILNLVSVKMSDPDKFLPLFACVARLAGAIAAGFVSARLSRESVLMQGLLPGIFFSVVIFAVAAFLPHEFNFFSSLIQCLVCVALSSVAGFLGLPKQQNSKGIHKKMIKRIKSA